MGKGYALVLCIALWWGLLDFEGYCSGPVAGFNSQLAKWIAVG
jgi:hypothetical protein